MLTETNVRTGFPGSSVIKNSSANARDMSLISSPGRLPGEGNGNPVQYSCLDISMDRGVWYVVVHGVAKNWTQFSLWTMTSNIRTQ